MNTINKYFNDNTTEPQENRELLIYFQGICNTAYYNKNEKRFYKEYNPFRIPLYYIYDVTKWIYKDYITDKKLNNTWYDNKIEPEENMKILFYVRKGYGKFSYYSGTYIKKGKIFMVDNNRKYHISKVKSWIYIN